MEKNMKKNIYTYTYTWYTHTHTHIYKTESLCLHMKLTHYKLTILEFKIVKKQTKNLLRSVILGLVDVALVLECMFIMRNYRDSGGSWRLFLSHMLWLARYGREWETKPEFLWILSFFWVSLSIKLSLHFRNNCSKWILKNKNKFKKIKPQVPLILLILISVSNNEMSSPILCCK